MFGINYEPTHQTRHTVGNRASIIDALVRFSNTAAVWCFHSTQRQCMNKEHARMVSLINIELTRRLVYKHIQSVSYHNLEKYSAILTKRFGGDLLVKRKRDILTEKNDLSQLLFFNTSVE